MSATPKVKALTDAQAETLETLFSECWHSAEHGFWPNEAFPKRNNQDNGARRCLTSLARLGFLETLPDGRYRVVQSGLSRPEYQAWLEQQDGDR